MTGHYAKNTSVSSHKTRDEIEMLLQKYGATGFGYILQGRTVAIEFCIFPKGETQRRVRFIMELPDPNSRDITHTPNNFRKRDREVALKEWEKACRAYWRALLMVIRAKLEAIEIGISSFDREFLANLLTGDGRTVYEHVQSQLPSLEAGGSMKLLPTGDQND